MNATSTLQSGLSIIICCYNSAARLPVTLAHLAAQQGAGFAWEVILVDNNSSDGTAAVAEREWQRHGAPAPLRVVAEPRPGLLYARERGLASIAHELILFCDDDNWLAPDYLREACVLMQDGTIGILGGRNVAVADAPLPAWFAGFEQAYACGPQAAHDGDVSSARLYIAGAGMVTRHAVYRALAELGFRSYLTGRTGASLSSGEDTEFSIVTALLGYRLVYSSRLVLKHYMEPARLRWSYFLKLNRGHAQSYYKLALYKQLYTQGQLNPDWLAYFKSAPGLGGGMPALRRLLRWGGLYARRAQQREGNEAAVEAFFNIELWRMHLRFRAEYPSFVAALNALGQRLRQYRGTHPPRPAAGAAPVPRAAPAAVPAP
ncbi:glycosyltransferase [uncultured Hymenobacter sp.]|uniref:glycosyltransferase n=1 Tax=uncultured Hymenobacter sp. TaxID=170016 RepID=UPI0035CC091E